MSAAEPSAEVRLYFDHVARGGDLVHDRELGNQSLARGAARRGNTFRNLRIKQ